MSYFIVIHGPLGSGKSTLAKALTERLSAERVQIDDVLSKHQLDLHEDGEACIPAKNFIQALDQVLPNMRQLLDGGKIVIIDGCFYHQEVMEYLLQQLPFPHILFTLHAPLEVCIERDQRRPKTLGEDAARAVYHLTSGLHFGHTIDSTQPIEASIKKLLGYVPATR